MTDVEEYLRTSYEPEMEYVDGRLVDRHVGDYFHSFIQAAAAGALGRRERERKYHVFIALRIRLGPTRYRVPDVCVKAIPYQVAPILERPDLAIEILSPEDEPGEMLAKIADYASGGVPVIWVVDPYKRALTEVVNGVIRRPETQVLSTPLVGDVDFAELFEELYEPMA